MDLELHQLELKYKGMRILYAGQQSQLMSSLSEHGQHSPVLVVETARDRYMLIDGYKRVEALGRLGRDTVEALVLQMDELEALVFSHRQQNARPREALEDGWLIRELMKGHGLSMEEVAARLGRTRSWVSRRLGLVKALPSEVQELVRVGRLCPYAAARFLVPLARANTEHCIRLAAGIGGKRLSASQVGQLYVGWRRADELGRQRLVEHPLLYLKVEEELAEPEVEGEQLHGALLSGIEGLGGLSRRVRKLLRTDDASRIRGRHLKVLGNAWRESRAAFDSTASSVEEWLNAGHGQAHGDLGVEERGARDQDHCQGTEGIAQVGAQCPGERNVQGAEPAKS